MIFSAPPDTKFQLAEQKRGGFGSSVFATEQEVGEVVGGGRLAPLCHSVSEEPRDTALQERHDEV